VIEGKHTSFVGSFRYAWAGLRRALRNERNMKIHVVASMMVSIIGMSLQLDLASRSALLFSVTIVWFAEVLNTALEAFVNLHIREFHHLAMIAKDAAAGAVLVAAAATVFVFGDVLYESWGEVVANPHAVLRGVGYGVPLTFVTIAILFRPAGAMGLGLLALVALGCLLGLVWSATNLVFAALALAILGVIVAAQWRPDAGAT
jgi:diacylglycerol kinase